MEDGRGKIGDEGGTNEKKLLRWHERCDVKIGIGDGLMIVDD